MRPIDVNSVELYEMYVDQGLSLRNIAKRYECDPGVIARALKRFEVPIRHPTAAQNLPIDELRNLYSDRQLSTYAIAEIYNCDPKTVFRYLKEYGIPTRPKKKIALKEDILERLYAQEGKSLYEISEKYGYSPAGILKKMKEYGIERRSTSETSTKHPKSDFNGSKEDRAYLIGFRIGDLSIRKRKNLISVSSGTTKDAQARLIHSLFSPYGPVWIGNPDKRGAFNVSCLLNQSFSFLIPKDTTLPRWVQDRPASFFSFLAGYADAEGNFGVVNGMGRFRLRSYDVGILGDLHDGLRRRGIQSTFTLASKAGVDSRGVKQNKDCWCLAVSQKDALHKMLSVLLPLLRHDKRKADAQLVMQNVTNRLN